MAGVYVHIPFCKSKCLYCGFNSFPGMEGHFDAYVRSVLEEARRRAGEISGEVSSVYFGGGTPTILPADSIAHLLEVLRDLFDIPEGVEISIEANPETVDVDELKVIRNAGFNRLSLGFQALDDDLLGFLERRHSSADAISAFEAARNAGFDNVSVDLIFGIPGQSRDDWANALARTAELSPEHVSAYSLTVDEDAALCKLVEEGGVDMPDEDAVADMFEFAIDFLTGEGFEHYEISNFAVPGMRCRHNEIYWEFEDYLGLGAGAHSKIGMRRIENASGVREYIELVRDGRQSSKVIELDRESAASEALFLGLRKIEGVELRELRDRFGAEAIDRYSAQIADLELQDLLIESDGRLRLTRRGIFLGNEVFSRFA